jgi:hypothetical protein
MNATELSQLYLIEPRVAVWNRIAGMATEGCGRPMDMSDILHVIREVGRTSDSSTDSL